MKPILLLIVLLVLLLSFVFFTQAPKPTQKPDSILVESEKVESEQVFGGGQPPVPVAPPASEEYLSI